MNTLITFAQHEVIKALTLTVNDCTTAEKITANAIIAPFSTTGDYNKAEQTIIQGAIAILATKLVSQAQECLITSSQATKQFLQLKIGTSAREIFSVIFMNNENRVIAYEELSVGTIDAAAVYPREIAKRALELNTKSIIIAHNHPSGVLESSNADDQITARIGRVCEMLDIRLLDHVIVSPKGTFSYMENGKMPY